MHWGKVKDQVKEVRGSKDVGEGLGIAERPLRLLLCGQCGYRMRAGVRSKENVEGTKSPSQKGKNYLVLTQDNLTQSGGSINERGIRSKGKNEKLATAEEKATVTEDRGWKGGSGPGKFFARGPLIRPAPFRAGSGSVTPAVR